MASYDAQINLILKGSSELKKLSSTLEAIEDTASSIQNLFERGVFGRATDIKAYINALGQIEKTAAATRLQAAAIADVNAETKRALIVESQLRRERSRTARLSRAFEIETKGLDQTKGKLREIKEQFDEVSVALKSAFKLGDVRIISQLRNELSALVEDQREWNRTLAGTKNTGINADFLKEQARGYAQQIEQLRKRALALSENEEIIRRLAAAEFNLVKQRDKNTGAFTQFADPRLGRELLSNIKAQITAEEQLARERERFSGQYERQQKEARRQAVSTAQTIAAIARKAGGATFDALTFGQGAKVARGARNAAIRGGLGIGALGLGGAYAATQEALGNINLGLIQGPAVEAANAIGGAINNALGGVPAIINDMLSALGNVPGSLGLASVAALAFAPAMKTAADAVFLAGKRFGATKFGENIKLTLDRQTNLFESVINKASEMNMVLDASRSGLDAVGKKIETLPALPAAGQTAFAGPMRRGRGGAFIGGGARELLSPEFLATATGAMAQRTQEAADTSLLFAEGLGQAATEAKTIAEYLKQANELRAKGESSTQRFIRQTIERGRIATQGRQSAEIARERSAFLTGSSYSLSQVPARGELFPGGRTETAQSAYRELLNTTARINQLQQDLLEKMSKQQGFSATIGQLERRTINDKGRSLVIQQQENEELQRSVQIIRERNKELRQRPIAAMTPRERVSQGILDPESLRANRERRIEIGRLDPLERFYAGFQPRRLAARSARATSEGLVGGAFPLLFGQGLGAAVGGGAGGALGGFAGGGLGFGLSLAGTALGTAFDTAVQGATELGAALNDSAETFDKVKERALFSSKETERFADRLQEAGFVASASIVSQQEVISKIGRSGAASLKELSASSDRLNRAWSELNLQLQAALAGPMADLLEWVANIVDASNRRGRSQAAVRDVIPQDEAGRARFERELTKAYNETYGTSFSGNGTPRGSIEDTIKFLSFDEKGRAALAELSKQFPPVELGVTVKETQEVEEKIAELTKQLELIDIGKPLLDQVRQAVREQQDLDKQRADLVRSYEESLGDIRKRVEDEISSKRFATLEKENQLLDIQGQIRLRQLQIANQADIAQAGIGLRPEAEQAAREVAQLVATFTEQQVSAEEEAAKIKRDAALESQKIDFDAARLKAEIEKEVSRLNVETARRVADINDQVRRRNEEFDANRFKLEKAIAELQLKNNEIIAKQQLDTARKNLETARQAGDAQGAAYAQSFINIYESQLDIIKKGQKDISSISAPPQLRGVGQVGGGGVPTAGLDRATADLRKAADEYVAAQLAFNELDVVANNKQFAQGIQEIANKADAALAAIQIREEDAQLETLRYIELVNAGLTDTVAQKVIELETTKRISLAILDAAITQLNSKIVAGQVTEEVNKQNLAYLEQIKILQERRAELEGRVGKFDPKTRTGTGQVGQTIENERGKSLQTFIATATAELNDLEGVAIRVSQGIGDAVGNSLANGITGLIEGTTTAKEIFANFLKDVGQILIEEGTKIIGTYVLIGIARAFAGLQSGSSTTSATGTNPGGIPSTGNVTGPSVNGFDTGSIGNIAANGAYFDGGMSYFANGGIVSSPTLFQFADGGIPRNGLMGEAGPEAIMPLKRGANGKLGVQVADNREFLNSVSPDAGGDGMESGGAEEAATLATRASVREIERLQENRTQIMTQQMEAERRYERERIEQMASTPGNLNIKYESQVINNVEYVTREQAERMAAQSALRGRELAIGSLQNSVKTRKRVGMS